jgi:hypothetical protein
MHAYWTTVLHAEIRHYMKNARRVSVVRFRILANARWCLQPVYMMTAFLTVPEKTAVMTDAAEYAAVVQKVKPVRTASVYWKNVWEMQCPASPDVFFLTIPKAAVTSLDVLYSA